MTGKQGANDLQRSMFRAGHAHAGVLVILGLVVLLLLDSASVPARGTSPATGVLISAILIPAGFFISVIGHDPARPNRFVILLWIGFGVSFLGFDCQRHWTDHRERTPAWLPALAQLGGIVFSAVVNGVKSWWSTASAGARLGSVLPQPRPRRSGNL
ncbi:hypothetical protein ACX80R_12970 [Paeniglutamicibacter antarcticus]